MLDWRADSRWDCHPRMNRAVRHRYGLSDPGKPWQNGAGESFNGKLRDDCLSLEWFRSRREASIVIECLVSRTPLPSVDAEIPALADILDRSGRDFLEAERIAEAGHPPVQSRAVCALR